MKKPTANYKVIADTEGVRYQFFCDLSGARICTTRPIQADTPELALEIAWETEGKQAFNLCQKCGKWISDAMYNADIHQCVECTPWEIAPRYCPQCGKKIIDSMICCPRCGTELRYGGKETICKT